MPEPEKFPLSAETLRILHACATHLQQTDNPLLFVWGLHLLEDWRSLELLAEKHREPGEMSSESVTI